jgi:hypothetical protein
MIDERGTKAMAQTASSGRDDVVVPIVDNEACRMCKAAPLTSAMDHLLWSKTFPRQAPCRTDPRHHP